MTKRPRRPAKTQPRRPCPFPKPASILIGPHRLPKSWRPFIGHHACIHHGHGLDPDDHSRCGPVLFCCPKASARYLDLLPTRPEASADWHLTDADHIARWLDPGVTGLYFLFCDPQRPAGLWAIGLSEEPLRQTLYQQLPLEAHLDRADRLA